MRHCIRRGLAAASVVTVAALALAACSGSGDSGDGGGEEDFEPLTSVKLQLQWLPQAQFAGYYVAQEKGYFEEEGFDAIAIVTLLMKETLVRVAEPRLVPAGVR